jgi:putative heme-binding domain-containing protein
MFDVIAYGIPGSEMPGHWFPDREVWQLVAFVRTLGRVVPLKIAGDGENGEKLYTSKGGCTQCHTIDGKGGAIGPDLTDIGARRSPAYLRESLVKPEAGFPEGFLQVQLLTQNGRRITGVRLNEDTFSIQVRDLSGEFLSFFKSELKELSRMPGKSPMPSYSGVFTASELDDLVAYLDSLRGSQ